MRRKSSIILTALIMACAVTACQGSASSPGGRNDSEDGNAVISESVETETESETSVRTLSEVEEQKLYNTYIDINNSLLDRVINSLGRYFDYVDIEQEEFTLLDPTDDYFDCHSISDTHIGKMEDAYGLVSRKVEKDKLDEAFLDMYPSLYTVIVTLNEIDVYTEMESYLDDDYAKAKEYHTKLMGVLEEYMSTSAVFLNELDVVADARQAEAYEQMKEEGLEVSYAMNKAIDLANDIVEELANQGVWDENVLDMDVEAVQPLYDEFISYVDALIAYDNDEEKLNAEGLYKNSGYWTPFLRDVKNAKASLTEVMDKVKEGEELSYSDQLMGSIAGNGSLSSFATGLSDMIDDFNRMVY